MFVVSSLHHLKNEADLNNKFVFLPPRKHTYTVIPLVLNLSAASFYQVGREVLIRTMIILNKTCIRINF
jgi:hypothetical protein